VFKILLNSVLFSYYRHFIYYIKKDSL